MAKYGFAQIEEGGAKEYSDGFDLTKVRAAALKFAKSNGIPIRTRLSRDGKTLIVMRGPFKKAMPGRCIYGFSSYEVEESRTYRLGQTLNGYVIDSLYKVRYAALKYGMRNGMVFKTRSAMDNKSIDVKRFS